MPSAAPPPPTATPRAATGQTADAAEFWETLAKSGLLPEDKVAAERARLEGAGPHEAAAALADAGRVTRYQAQRLLAGRYRGFFLDRYRLLSVLGAGGMGTVYVAKDEGDGPTGGKTVAVKVLAAGTRDDAGMIARLRYEGVAGGRVDHPNVVRALRFCKADNGPGDYLLAMEYVEAVSAEELLVRGGPQRPGVAADVAAQAARGLAACHAAGLIHRDVKPANLLVDAAGGVKVADFGLALLTDQAAGEFSLQMIFGHDCLGSADYMAPEQSRDSAAVDARADVYSLGCTLYSLLTARVPYPGKNSREVFRGHRNAPVPDVRAKAPETPARLAEYVHALMAKDPADRPGSMAEVADRLETWAKRKPVRFDFEAILAARAKAAAKKEEARRAKRAARRRALRGEADDPDGPAAGGSSGTGSSGRGEAARETKTTAQLDTSRPDRPGHASSAVLPAVGGRSAADFAGQLLGQGGSAAAGSRLGSRVGSRTGSSAVSGVETGSGSRVGSRVGRPEPAAGGADRDVEQHGDAAPPDAAPPAPVEFPPTTLTPGRGWRAWFGRPVAVPAASAVVGRGRDGAGGNGGGCDVPVDEPGVSGKHCRLTWDGGAWAVEDLRSRNGTAVNDVPVLPAEPVPVGPGDVLTLAGKYPFTLAYGRPGAPKGPRLLAAVFALLAAAAGGAWWVWF